MRCDHTVEEEVGALFERVRKEQGRLDILVNNAWGGYEGKEHLMPQYFWQSPWRLWDAMFERGVKAHLLASYCAIPLMIESAKARRPGVIVSTVAWDHNKYIGGFYDFSKHAIVRMIYGLGIELQERHVATVALAPGFMRTERVMSHAQGGETDWKKISWLKDSESPEYLGRAVAALAEDKGVMEISGKAFHVGELSRKYRFTDLDGKRVKPFLMREPFVDMVKRFNGDKKK